jgi:F-type H+-transporting ATPase subunit b
MLIDWFTVGAQLLNFLILVWLMKHFLYQPVLAAIAARESRIAAELATAAAKLKDAQQQQTDYEQKILAFEQQRDQLLADAVNAAQAERTRRREQDRLADAALRQRRNDAWQREQLQLNQAIVVQTRDEVFAIARRALAELADTSLEACMVRLFALRLKALAPAAREQLDSALQAHPAAALVRSAYPLSTEQRGQLQAALQDCGVSVASLGYETAPALVAGIEFSVSGWTLEWNIAAYLKELGQRVDALLQAAAGVPEAEAASPAVPATAANTRPAATATTRPDAEATVAESAAPVIVPEAVS